MSEHHNRPSQHSEWDEFIPSQPVDTLSPPVEPHRAGPSKIGYGLRSVVERPDPELDEKFRAGFENAVSDLNFQELMIVPEDWVVAEPERFSFAPVTSYRSKSFLPSSMSSAGGSVDLPPGARCTYFTGKPFLDAAQAIGLMNEDWLIAIGAMGVDVQGRLHIVQIQDVTGVRSRVLEVGEEKSRMVNNWKAFSQTGLRSGFLWRNTLVHAAEQVAQTIGIPEVVVRSHVNASWETVRQMGKKGYDDVAQQMGYRLVEPELNWVKRISLPPEHQP